MTKAEYNQYLKELLPYIDKKSITQHSDPVVVYKLLGAEPYEEGTNEWPKALFRSAAGKLLPMDMKYALELIRKG